MFNPRLPCSCLPVCRACLGAGGHEQKSRRPGGATSAPRTGGHGRGLGIPSCASCGSLRASPDARCCVAPHRSRCGVRSNSGQVTAQQCQNGNGASRIHWPAYSPCIVRSCSVPAGACAACKQLFPRRHGRYRARLGHCERSLRSRSRLATQRGDPSLGKASNVLHVGPK